MDKPKWWVKMQLKNVQLKVKVKVGLKSNYIGFVHIWPKFGFKQPSIV